MKWRDKIEINLVKTEESFADKQKKISNSLESFFKKKDFPPDNKDTYSSLYRKKNNIHEDNEHEENSQLSDLQLEIENVEKQFQYNDVEKNKKALNNILNNSRDKNIVDNKNIKDDEEKDHAALFLLFLSAIGATYLALPTEMPAIGKSFFLGFDINIWWSIVKTVGIISAPLTAFSLVERLRGDSKFLHKLFNKSSKNKISKKWSAVYFTSIFISIFMLNFSNQGLFKSNQDWKDLESQKIDSRYPEKRALFNGVINPDINMINEAKKSASDNNNVLPSPSLILPPSDLQEVLQENNNEDNLSTEQNNSIPKLIPVQPNIRTDGVNTILDLHKQSEVLKLQLLNSKLEVEKNAVQNALLKQKIEQEKLIKELQKEK